MFEYFTKNNIRIISMRNRSKPPGTVICRITGRGYADFSEIQIAFTTIVIKEIKRFPVSGFKHYCPLPSPPFSILSFLVT